MGKTYSKREEVIIAQNGANNASQSTLEQKFDKYGIVVICLLSAVMLIGIYLLYKRCNRGIKKWARKELGSVAVLNVADKAVQQNTTPVQAQTVQYSA